MAARKSQHTLQVEGFLAEFVTPHLRAAGYRKVSHTYRLRMPNGDEAGMWFRAHPVGALGSFLFDVWVCVEPIWDLQTFDPDRARRYPDRTHEWDARWSHRQLRHPVARSPSWLWQSADEREEAGRVMRGLLLDDLIPRFARWLDRWELLGLARNYSTELPARDVRTIYRALLVDAGPSVELDHALIHTAASKPGDGRFLAWAAARSLDGPTWRALSDPPDPDAIELEA